MSKIDENFTVEQVKEIVKDCTSMRELSRRLGYQSIGNNNRTIKNYLEKNNIDFGHFTGLPSNVVKRTPENVFIKDSTATQATVRRWYVKGEYTPYKCSICGLEPFWNGKELTLTLDHINGDNHDDRLDNLRWVCPNCDRQLPTFGAKNIKNKIENDVKIEHIFSKENKTNNIIEVESFSPIKQKKTNFCVDCGCEISLQATRCINCAKKHSRVVERPSSEELFNILISYKGNFTQVAKIFKVTDNAVRKWCKSYDLPYHSSDYK